MNNLTRYENNGIELIIDLNTGESFATLKGYSRMSGVAYSTIKKRVKKGDAFLLSKQVQIPTAGGMQRGYLLTENIIADWIVDDNPAIAKQLLKAGIRIYLHGLAGFKYQIKKQLTREEIIEICCLPVPAKWQRRFPEQFYSELCRLTGLQQQGNKRPAYWGKLTKELVYDYLPTGLYDRIKACKADTGSYDKLHQYLSEEGLVALEEHQRRLLTYMEASSTLKELNNLLIKSRTKQYQLPLF